MARAPPAANALASFKVGEGGGLVACPVEEASTTQHEFYVLAAAVSVRLVCVWCILAALDGTRWSGGEP